MQNIMKNKGCCWLLEQSNFNTENLLNLIMETIKNENKLENIREKYEKKITAKMFTVI